MSRVWVDTLSQRSRRYLMGALIHTPSLAAMVAGMGLTSTVSAATVFGLYTALQYRRYKAEKHYCDIFSDIRSEDRRTFAPAQLQTMSAGLSAQFGLEKPVAVYLYQRAHNPAFTDGETIGFTRQANALMMSGEKRFIIAHELSHIKSGDPDHNMHLLMRASAPVRILMATSAGLSLATTFWDATHIGSIALGVSSAYVLRKAQKLVMAFNTRSNERCRDYEAVQATGDLKSALSSVEKLERLKHTASLGFWQRVFYTHPLGEKRRRNLRDAYEDGIRKGIILSAPPVNDAQLSELQPRQIAAF